MERQDDRFIVFASETDVLWAAMTGRYREEGYDYGDVAEELAGYGDAAAEVVLRDLEDAVAVEYDDAGDVEDVTVDVGRFGEENVPEVYRMLRKIGGKTAHEALALLCLINDADDTGRFEQTLGESGTPEAIHVLVRRLSGSAPAVATAAVAALHRIGGRAVPAVCACVIPVPGKSWPSDGIACARWLGDRGDPDAVPTLVAALTGDNDEIAVAAAASLGRIGHPDAYEPLIALLSPDAAGGTAPIRRTTGQALPFEAVRAAAAWALGRIGDRRALDCLVSAIGAHDPWTSGEAAGAVAALGGDSRAVLPTLRADLPSRWRWADRIEAVRGMAPDAFDALITATEAPEAPVRALALRVLDEAVQVSDPGATARRREQAAASAASRLGDPSASVRISAVRLLQWLDAPGRADLLLPMLGETDSDELGMDAVRDVGEAVAYALPDDDDSRDRLRLGLVSGRSDATTAWRAFADGRARHPRMARGGDVVAPYVLRAAQGGGEDAIQALRDPILAGVLAGLSAEIREAAEVLATSDARVAEREAERRAREPASPPRPKSSIEPETMWKLEPEWKRVVRLHNTQKIDDDAYCWLLWSDADLTALPLDLRQAWAEGPRAWASALRGTGLDSSPPHDRAVGTHTVPEFRAAVSSYMKSHLSAEDHAWYSAGERVKTMRPEAQEAWRKGPSVWAAFLTRSSPVRQV